MRELINKNPLFFYGLLTIILFPLLSWPLLVIQEINIYDVFSITINDLFLIPIFISIGLFFGMLLIRISEMSYFELALSPIKAKLSGIKITRLNAIFISLCAGIGEEIFFRGALQPLIGIWITSFGFVLIHRYFSFRNLRLNILGFLLTLFIVFLGWSAQKCSIWLAISAHFSYDLVQLSYFRIANSKPK